MDFFEKAVWDDEAKVFYSDSDIVGLHIEAETLEGFREILVDIGPELIFANHVTNEDLLTKPLKDLIPTIWSGADEEFLQQSRGDHPQADIRVPQAGRARDRMRYGLRP